MDRKKKIIISVVGIFIITLILVGLTYGYYLANIKGNLENTSVTLSTDYNLALEYCEYHNGNYVCDEPTGAIAIEAKNIIPGENITEMKFQVKNTGNETVADYGIYLEDVINTFERKEDITLKVTCESNKKNKCSGYNGLYPENNTLLFENAIDEGEIHTFTLKVDYINRQFDQSVDMGKTLSGKINVYYQPEVVDITGTVTFLNAGDRDISDYIVYTNSWYVGNNKFSKIVKNNYRLTGLFLQDNDIDIAVEPHLSFTSFKIIRGKEASIDESTNTITIADNTQEVIMNITYDFDSDKVSYTFGNISPNNPYIEGTLAYNILNNSYNNLNGTEYVATPPSKVASEISLPYWNKAKETSSVISSSTDITDGVYAYTSNASFISRLDEFAQLDSSGKPSSEFINKCFTNIDITNMTATPTNAAGCEEIGIFPKSCEETKGSYLYDTKQVTYVSSCNADGTAVLTTLPKAERVLSKTLDDDGTSYYYRGAVEDNYVDFANKCWRIVRVEGDGNVKLVLEDKDSLCANSDGSWDYASGNYGVNSTKIGTLSWSYKTNYNNPESASILSNGLTSSNMKTKFNDFATELSSYSDKLESKQICIGDTTTAYNPDNGNVISPNSYYHYKEYRDLKFDKDASLICDANNMTESSIVFPLTANEVIFAGGVIGNTNYNYYLLNNYQINKSSLLSELQWFTLSVGDYYSNNDRIISVANNGKLFLKNAKDSIGFRPAVSLKNVSVTGSGTKTDPYVVS